MSTEVRVLAGLQCQEMAEAYLSNIDEEINEECPFISILALKNAIRYPQTGVVEAFY